MRGVRIWLALAHSPTCRGASSRASTAGRTALTSSRFDFIKLGGWVEAQGPLSSPTTNQRLYRIGPDGGMEDITERFRRKP